MRPGVARYKGIARGKRPVSPPLGCYVVGGVTVAGTDTALIIRADMS